MSKHVLRLLRSEPRFRRWLSKKPAGEVVGMANTGRFCPLRTWLSECGVHDPHVGATWVESTDGISICVDMIPTPEWMREIIWRVDRWGDERGGAQISAGELRELLAC